MHHLPCNQLASCRRGRVRRRRPCRPSRSRWAACRSSRPTSPAEPDTARPQPRQSLRAMCEQEQLIVHRNSIRKCMMLNEQRPIREIGYNVICIFSYWEHLFNRFHQSLHIFTSCLPRMSRFSIWRSFAQKENLMFISYNWAWMYFAFPHITVFSVLTKWSPIWPVSLYQPC